MRSHSLLTTVLIILIAGLASGENLAPVNPFQGQQEREEVFEFAKKPQVKKERGKWIITFASKAACDATVAILDKEGRIIRHLASGVLGKNSPYPFQQDSLVQKIEWDGLTDDFQKAPGDCSVRVGLGLKARFDRNLAYDPYLLPGEKGKLLVGKGPEGQLHVISEVQNSVVGRVFDRNGKYLRTFLPVPARQVEEAASPLGLKLGTTKWGEKVLVCNWFGPYARFKDGWEKGVGPGLPKISPGMKFEPQPRPKEVPDSTAPGADAIVGLKFVHLAADRARDEIYVGLGAQHRFSGTSGELDRTWFPDNGLGQGSPVCEAVVGPDGYIYLRFGPHCYGRHMIRVDHEGNLVPFPKEHTVHVPGGDGWWTRLPKAFSKGVDAVFCGVLGHSNTFTHGLYVSPSGKWIVGGIQEVDAKWAREHGLAREAKGPEIPGTYVPVWDRNGKLLSASALGDTRHGHGLGIDREGNIYAVIAGVLPEGQKTLEGSDIRAEYRTQGGYGSLVKFRGRGGQYPLGQVVEGKEPLADALRLGARKVGPPSEWAYVTGALWVQGGVVGQSAGDCCCHHIRHDMDFFARSFLPANQLYAIVVLDANGNRMARFGAYGNVDDTEADLKAGRDGLRFAWPRAVAVSDKALYVADQANRRILRATLFHTVEEKVLLP